MKYKTQVNIKDFLFIVRTTRAFKTFETLRESGTFNPEEIFEDRTKYNELSNQILTNTTFKYDDISQQAESNSETNTPFDIKSHKIDEFMVDVYKTYKNIIDSEETVKKVLENFDFFGKEVGEEIKKIATTFKRIFKDLMLYYKYEESQIKDIQKDYLKNMLQDLIDEEEYEKAAEIRDRIKEC